MQFTIKHGTAVHCTTSDTTNMADEFELRLRRCTSLAVNVTEPLDTAAPSLKNMCNFFKQRLIRRMPL